MNFNLCRNDCCNPLEETKYIVSESMLMELFNVCRRCQRLSTPTVHQRVGTMVKIAAECEFCGFTWLWCSQPHVGSIPAGNIGLSASILFPSLQSPASPEVHGSCHNHPEDLFKSSGLSFVPCRGQSMGQAAERLRHQSWGQRKAPCYWRWWTSRLSRALCEVWLLQHHWLGGGNRHWHPTCTGNDFISKNYF